MRTSWTVAVSLALAGCGAEFTAVDLEIVDGGDEAGEVEAGQLAASQTGIGSRRIVSAVPRPARVVSPTQPARISSQVVAERVNAVLEVPERAEAGFEIAAR